jgi:nicotinamide-nucleotide amidase
MTVAILSIGTELTRGEVTNTNATWLSEELTRLGVDVTEGATVPDDPVVIEATLRRLAGAHTLIVSTGGLGPTTDDITTECVAAVVGAPLERDQASLDAITARHARFGRTMAASNAKQSDFPRGATVLPNPHGTAPGFSVNIGGARAFFMPGVPGEMKPMFQAHVAAAAAHHVDGGIHQIRIRTFGMAESAVNDRLAGIETKHGVVIGYRAHFPEIEVKVRARGGDDETAKRVARAAADEVVERLGEVVYAEGDEDLAEAVAAELRQRHLSFGTAESCTGGLVANLLTNAPGASDYFRGAIVAYANDVKTAALGVPEALLAAHGAVSAEVARAMAEGARRALGVDVALSLTGIAGPSGGTPEKPVGLVHFAVASAGGTTDRTLLFPSGRPQIRLMAAYAGLTLVRRIVRGGHAP